MLDVVYRFRTVRNLLERGDLECRQIYLALPHELNDPMEGYKDVVWRGDEVLWENLLRHYVLSLLLVTSQCILSPAEKFEEPTFSAATTEDDLPSDVFRSVFAEACHDFFARLGPSNLHRAARRARATAAIGWLSVLRCG